MLPPWHRVGPYLADDGDAHDPEERGQREADGVLAAGDATVVDDLDAGEHAHRLVRIGVLPRQCAAVVPVRDHSVGHAGQGPMTVMARRSRGSAPRTKIGPVTTRSVACWIVRAVGRRERRSRPPGPDPDPRGGPRGPGCRS